jgi:hypothetical protein
MKKTILILTILIIGIFLLGCIEENQEVTYKNVETAFIPTECASFENDTCELFECMTNNCWCDSGNILMSSPKNALNKEDAIEVFEMFIATRSQLSWHSKKVTSATKLNNIFWNVFVEDDGLEEVYVVAVDGTVIKPACGV